MLKKFFLFLFLGLILFVCGCDNETPIVLFNNQPINKVTVHSPVDFFELGETTHFVVFNPKGFESPYLRMQLIKKDTKVQNWGFKIATSKDIKIDMNKNYYIDSIQVSQAGTYIFSLFYLNDLNRPIVRGMFVVKK